MLSFDRAECYFRYFSEVSTGPELADLLDELAREMGFAYFALTHHVDVQRFSDKAIRLLNYPGDWVEYYDAHSLGVADPVHRASHVTNLAFPWSKIPDLIALTQRDRDILARGGLNGIGDGYTVPAHIPGESHGSCTFANPRGVALPENQLPLAQLIGQFAFDAARRLSGIRPKRPEVSLTDRQRQCLKWAALGKTDWEIAKILGISRGTVILHLKAAREYYGGCNRTLSVVHALRESTLTFPDIFDG